MKKKVDYRQNNRNRFKEDDEGGKKRNNENSLRRKNNLNTKLREVAEHIMDGDFDEDFLEDEY